MSEAEDWRARMARDESLVDISEVIALAKDAADGAMRWREQHPKEQFPKLYKEKNDGSLVTQADELVSDQIIEKLKKLTPNIPVVSEEAETEGNLKILRQARGTYWCVDPIDGTSNFAKGGKGWGVLIGLVKNGVPTEGVAFYPEIGGPAGQLYYTQAGNAYLETAPTDDDGVGGVVKQLLKVYPSLDTQRELKANAAMGKHPAFGDGKMSFEAVRRETEDRSIPPQPELMVARGDMDVVYRPKCEHRQTPSIWDSAAPLAILFAAGGVALAHDGQGGQMETIDWVNPDSSLKMQPFIAGAKETMKTHGLIGKAEETLLQKAAIRSLFT